MEYEMCALCTSHEHVLEREREMCFDVVCHT